MIDNENKILIPKDLVLTDVSGTGDDSTVNNNNQKIMSLVNVLLKELREKNYGNDS